MSEFNLQLENDLKAELEDKALLVKIAQRQAERAARFDRLPWHGDSVMRFKTGYSYDQQTVELWRVGAGGFEVFAIEIPRASDVHYLPADSGDCNHCGAVLPLANATGECHRCAGQPDDVYPRNTVTVVS